MDKGEIIVYRAQDDDVTIDVLVENETVWLTQAQMAELFETTKQNVGQHIRNAFNDGEIVREVVGTHRTVLFKATCRYEQIVKKCLFSRLKITKKCNILFIETLEKCKTGEFCMTIYKNRR